MSEKPDVLRANCRRYIDVLEARGIDPMVIGALRRLVTSNSHTAARSTQLWQDNQFLRKEPIKLEMAHARELAEARATV